MSFGKKLCSKASDERYSEISKKIWDSMKQPLLDFATETKEPGCTIIFINISDSVIQEITKIAKTEEIELYYWYPGSAGHPGVEGQDLGLIAWNIDLFLRIYPFKVSPNILFVTLNESDKIDVEMRKAN